MSGILAVRRLSGPCNKYPCTHADLAAPGRSELHDPVRRALALLMLVVVGACFAVGFWWLHKISVMGAGPRLLTNYGGFANSEGSIAGNSRTVRPGE